MATTVKRGKKGDLEKGGIVGERLESQEITTAEIGIPEVGD